MREHGGRSGRRHWRRAAPPLAVVVLVPALYLGIGGWVVSSMLADEALRVGEPEPEVDVGLVTSVGSGTIGLRPNPGSGPVEGPTSSPLPVSEPGSYNVAWPGGQGLVSDIVSRDGDEVVRHFRLIDGAPPAPGTPVSMSVLAYLGTPREALDLSYEEVTVQGDLGGMPAYFVPASGDTWMVYVHGKGGSREEGYRVLSTMHAEGFPALLISYRNDEVAPAAPSGMYGYGLTEWPDLEAGVRYALHHGAERIVLVGESMGGALIGQFLEHSPLAEYVAGLLLDSPALDMGATIRDQAAERGFLLPDLLAAAGLWVADRRYPVRLGEAESVEAVVEFPGPVFVAHGTADKLVPVSVSDRLVAERNGPTSYLRVPGAAHVASWNLAREVYERQLREFAAKVGPAAPAD